MPNTVLTITIDPGGVSVAVNITNPQSLSFTAYTTRDGSTAVTFPVTISQRTVFYMDTARRYNVSLVGPSGENADGSGGVAALDLRGGQSASLGYVSTAGKGTYAPLDARDTSITSFTVGMLVSSGSSIYRVTTAHAAPFDSTKATQQGGTSLASAVAPGGAGVHGKGFGIPAGSLEVWRAARAASATTLCEVVGMGDSLARGEGPPTGLYSFIQRLREKSVAAGFTDGGRGYNNTGFGETLDNFSGEVAPISARSNWSAVGTWGPPGANYSNTPGGTITFKVQATRARLFWSRYTQGGRFSYSVNGGAAVTVQSGGAEAPPRTASNVSGQNPETILLTSADGMTSGTNTIVVTNLGGNPVQPPVLSSGNMQNGGAGNVPAGSWDYVLTRVAGGGETLASNIASITLASPSRVHIFTLVPAAAPYNGTYNVYRRVTGSGNPFQFAVQLVNGDPNTNDIGYDNSATTTATNPPTTNTAGLDPQYSNVAVNVEAINSTGIVWHQQGASGTALSDFFSVDDTFFNNDTALFSLGLQWGVTSPSANGIAAGSNSDVLPSAATSGTTFPQDPAKARKPSLVILAFGTNDAKMDRPTDQPGAATAVTAGVGNLAAATYYYKIKRVLPNTLFGPASPASAGTAANGSQQIAVTMGSVAFGYGPPPVWKVYRATSAGGTYAYIGETTGHGAVFLDNVVTPGANMPADVVNPGYGSRLIDTNGIIGSLGKAIMLIRNAGADPLIVLPSSENLALGGSTRGMNLMIKAAFKAAAEMFSCAWVDWDIALGPMSRRGALGYGLNDGNPHLWKPAYQAEGDFLWSKVLSI